MVKFEELEVGEAARYNQTTLAFLCHALALSVIIGYCGFKRPIICFYDFSCLPMIVAFRINVRVKVAAIFVMPLPI